jgi:hypothetical protein
MGSNADLDPVATLLLTMFSRLPSLLWSNKLAVITRSMGRWQLLGINPLSPLALGCLLLDGLCNLLRLKNPSSKKLTVGSSCPNSIGRGQKKKRQATAVKKKEQLSHLHFGRSPSANPFAQLSHNFHCPTSGTEVTHPSFWGQVVPWLLAIASSVAFLAS